MSDDPGAARSTLILSWREKATKTGQHHGPATKNRDTEQHAIAHGQLDPRLHAPTLISRENAIIVCGRPRGLCSRHRPQLGCSWDSLELSTIRREISSDASSTRRNQFLFASKTRQKRVALFPFRETRAGIVSGIFHYSQCNGKTSGKARFRFFKDCR